jgi:hypothetical protein
MRANQPDAKAMGHGAKERRGLANNALTRRIWVKTLLSSASTVNGFRLLSGKAVVT